MHGGVTKPKSTVTMKLCTKFSTYTSRQEIKH